MPHALSTVARSSQLACRMEKAVSRYLITIVLALTALNAHAQVVLENPEFAEKIDVVEQPGDTLPLDLPLIDAEGDTLLFGSLLDGKRPVILLFHYSDCPMLCSLVLDGLRNALNGMDFVPGKQYRVVTISLDPLETSQRTSGTQLRYSRELTHIERSEDAWRFFTAGEQEVRTITDAVGFRYYYDTKRREYMHPAVIVVLNGSGWISRYLYGIEFNPRDLKLALLEASAGKVGNTVDRLILYCFHYDPDAGSYVVLAGNVMRLGGAVTLVALGIFLGIMFVRDRASQRRESPIE